MGTSEPLRRLPEVTGGLHKTGSHQPSAEHFQQCAEFLPLRNRGLGPLAVPVLPIAVARRAAATACAAVQSTASLSSLVTGRACRSGSIRVFAVYPTDQSSRHFEPMRQPSEGTVVLYRPCLIRETQLELERRSCQSCSEVRRKLMRSMSSRY